MENFVGNKNLSMSVQIANYVENAPQALRFTSGSDYPRWHVNFEEALHQMLGPSPTPVPLEPIILLDQNIPPKQGRPAHRLQKIQYSTDAHSSAIGYLFSPVDPAASEKRQTVLVCHGHEPRKHIVLRDMFGGPWKKPYMEHIQIPAYRLLSSGFTVFAPVWRGFKERSMPLAYSGLFRDQCNVAGLAFGICGYSLLRLNLFDASRSIDLLENLGLVDRSGVGLIGKSYGGTIASLLGSLDHRIQATVVSGYLSTSKYALSNQAINTCGSQYIAGLLTVGDIPDVFGLIAPKPLLIESGMQDRVFPYDDATIAFERLSEIYAAANATEHLHRDVANVGHDYILNKAIPFFERYLR